MTSIVVPVPHLPVLLTSESGPVADALDALRLGRDRTLALLAPLSNDDATRQHDPLMSPIVWDLGHIAAFESLWLIRNLEGPIELAEMPGIFNPFEHPRSTRGTLRLPTLDEARVQLATVREQVERRLESIPFDQVVPLLRDAYVVRMVAQHERQHQETMLQTLQLKQGAPYQAPRGWESPPGDERWSGDAMVRFPGGRVDVGTIDRRESYDNERPRHTVDLRPFDIDVTAVTNGAYARFVERGGYEERRYWSDAGWSWRRDAGVGAPRYWEHGGQGWTTRMMDRTRPLDPLRPVCHVCWYEAEAFAQSLGKRLPTETEWETAATFDPATGQGRCHPWGDAPVSAARANVDQLAFETAQVGAYPQNVSPLGCYGMLGDVWEWTSSDFAPYPGYATFPYAEYSEVFFGSDYKVLRGGSWATAANIARPTFRNWDYPIRRQIFSGFRCARDV